MKYHVTVKEMKFTDKEMGSEVTQTPNNKYCMPSLIDGC